MTPDEQNALDLTRYLWNALVALPVVHRDDIGEARRDIHNIQNRIMARAVEREERAK